MQLKDGDEIDAVMMDNEEMYVLDQDGIIGMSIVMQLGQMSLVPWAKIQYEKGYTLLNLALAHEVHVTELTGEIH
jgi:hypothetical protein